MNTLETTGVIEEHIPQATDDLDSIKPIKHKDMDKVPLEDKGDRGEIEDEDITLKINYPIQAQ